MDRLDQVVGTAGPMLRRVDEVLTAAGAPAGHGVWTQLRRVRLLPADAVYAVAALRPAALTGAAGELRSHARAYAGVAASLPEPGDWSGEAADAYEVVRRRIADQLDDLLPGKLRATADLGDALTSWMQDCRDGLAATLAEILGSVEAVTLAATTSSVDGARSVPEADVVLAAADAGARVLRTVADGQDRGSELLDASAALAWTSAGR